MDRESYKKHTAMDIIDKMSLDELQYALGHYCGPSQIILSEKKFGIALPKRLVEEAIKVKTFEEAFFNETE